jgi:hypothetical protein
MKAIAALMLTGALGVLAGSLAAQPPRNELAPSPPSGVLYEGPVEIVVGTDNDPNIVETLRGDGRVYDGWVIIDDRQMVPRERVRRILLGDAGRRDDFGDQPGTGPNKDAGRGEDVPPKRRPFRED